jgi:hypothetical protein
MKNTYLTALQAGWPDATWSLPDIDNYDTLEWLTNEMERPTLDEVSAKLNELNMQEAMRLLKRERDILLQKSDVYALPDFPHSAPEKREEWLEYRQKLRDLPSTYTPELNDKLELDNDSFSLPIKPT